MKKTYMKPSVEVVNVNAESLICASPEFVEAPGTTPVDGGATLVEERLFGDFQPESFSFLW